MKWYREECKDYKIISALYFIFSIEECQLLSLGSIPIIREGNWVPFPVILRNMYTENLWRRYGAEDIDRGGNTDNILGRTMFTNAISAFTRAEKKRKYCVDYVLASLVYKNVANIVRIVEGKVHGVDDKRKFIVQLDGVEQYLKLSVVAHIGSDEDISYATGHSLNTNPLYADRKTHQRSCK